MMDKRPYIICHMVTSLDGKVTGEFLSRPETAEACEVYYELNRSLKCDGFICGRVTMEGSFTEGYYPDLSDYPVIEERTDLFSEDLSGFFAVAFDTEGKLGWKSNRIIDPDSDPGYDGAQIIEVLSEKVDGRYLSYLQSKNISYIFGGKDRIDINSTLKKLKELFGIERLLLEGGSIINGSFLRAGCVDEISLVVAPVVADKDDKPLFFDSAIADFEVLNSRMYDGVLTINYLKKG